MALEISTSGVTLKYAAEATAGTRPTSGYTQIPNIKSIPDMNAEPSQLEVTDLTDSFKRYIPGLRDVGGSLEFGANYTTAFKTAWNTVVELYSTSKAAGKSVWFEINVPSFGSFYFAGAPVELGLPSMETDEVFDGNVYIVPNQVEGWATASTT